MARPLSLRLIHGTLVSVVALASCASITMGCAKLTAPPVEETAERPSGTTTVQSATARPAPPPPPAAPEGNLQTTDIVVGKGAEAKAGDMLSVQYVGTLTNGTEFDSSRKPGRGPFEFKLGAGRVIRGWDQGLVGMKVGGKRKLVIPSSLAYGPTGQGSIPPNATLVFEVELVDIKK